jgi:hypothetical protein
MRSLGDSQHEGFEERCHRPKLTKMNKSALNSLPYGLAARSKSDSTGDSLRTFRRRMSRKRGGENG